jgi:hypothetical protein
MNEGPPKHDPKDYGLTDEDCGVVLRWLTFETRWNRFMNSRAYKSGESKLWNRQNQEPILFNSSTDLPGIVQYGIPIAVTLSLYAGYLWFLIQRGNPSKVAIAFGFGGALLVGLGLAFVAMDGIKMALNVLMQAYLRYIVSNLRVIKGHRHYHSALFNYREEFLKTNNPKEVEVGFPRKKCLICGETSPT